MAATEERIRSTMTAPDDPVVDELETMWTRPARHRRTHDLRRRTDGTLAVVWIGVMAALILFEPVPDNAAQPLWADAIAMTFLSAFGATVYGLSKARSWRFKASFATAGIGLTLAAACPASGHHAGMWGAIEAASFASIGALTWLAARRTA